MLNQSILHGSNSLTHSQAYDKDALRSGAKRVESRVIDFPRQRIHVDAPFSQHFDAVMPIHYCTVRPDSQTTFGESACLAGGLSTFPAKDLMALLLAHAGRLDKFGA